MGCMGNNVETGGEQHTKKIQLWLFRHGETEWSASGQHTGVSDIPLTAHGREQAEGLRQMIGSASFDLVLASPRQRARETCQLAGLDQNAHTEQDLAEWDYGEFEGLTTAQIQGTRAGWSVWDGPVVGGETVEQVGTRADRVIQRALAAKGRVALFAHGHILRILAARWIGLPARGGEHLGLDTASVSVLGFEHKARVIQRWNLVAAFSKENPPVAV